MALCGYRIFLLANCAILAAGAGRKEPVPLFFLANHGQAPPPVRFLAKAPGLTAYFSPGEVLFHVAGKTLRMHFEGTARASRPEAGDRLPGVANFMTGPKDRWLLEQPLYGGVVYRSLYPGIDMVYGRMAHAVFRGADCGGPILDFLPLPGTGFQMAHAGAVRVRDHGLSCP